MRVALSLLVCLSLAACDGETEEDAGRADAGPGLDAGSSGMDAGGVDAGRPDDAGGAMDAGPAPSGDAGGPDAGDECALGCDDGIGCTLDRCVAGSCVHEPRHRMCGENVFCIASMGCSAGEICVNDSDCPTSSDACVRDIRCSTATRVCAWDILDGDGDGEPPVVCGGTDCDDSAPAVFVGAPEACNGVDDDCDGTVDGASAMCPAGRSCVAGACACGSAETDCGADGCRDLSRDAAACGMCGNACLPGQMCTMGVCECPVGQALCSGACADLSMDTANCGTCGNACLTGGVCTAGACACAAGAVECATSCAVTATDPRNCGSCDISCLERATCGAGVCSSVVSNLAAWQSRSFRSSLGSHLSPHPGGDVTLGVEFREYLDEVPLTGIATTTSYAYFLSRRTSSGTERWRRAIDVSRGFADFLLAGDPAQSDVWIAGRIGQAGAAVDFGAGPATLSKTVAGVARYAGATGALVWSNTFASAETTTNGPDVIDTAVGPTGRLALLISLSGSTATDFGGGVLGAGLTSTHWGVVVLSPTGAHEGSWLFSSFRIRPDHIAVAPDGSVVVAGDYSNVAPTIAGTALPVAGSLQNAFIARYSPAGTGLGAFALSSPTASRGVRALAVASDGDVVIGTFDDFLARYSPTGTLRWSVPTARFPGPGASASVIRPFGTGVFVVGGSWNGYVLGGAPITSPRFYAEVAADGTVGRVRGFDWVAQDAWALSATRWTTFGTFNGSASLTEQIQEQTITLAGGGPRTPVGAYYFDLSP